MKNKFLSTFLLLGLSAPLFTSCGAKEYKVSCEVNGVTISNPKAVQGQDYKGTLGLNFDLVKDVLLPTSLTKLTSGNREILPNEYTYSFKDNHVEADVVIPDNLISGDVVIELELVEIKNWAEYPDWWNYCSCSVEKIKATADDIGKKMEVKVNNQTHKVRLIGLDHDELASKNATAHCTFEFVDYISDENGYSLATPWSWKFGESSNAQDYPNSNLRKSLDGQGNGEVVWYEKDSPTKSETYKTSLLEMLPEGLRGALKEVKKEVGVSYQFKVDSFNAKLFPLSYREVTAKVTTDKIAEEGKTYQYYKDNDVDATRIKHQVKWHDGAATNYTVITDVDYKSATAWNYAGFNSSYKDEYGGFCWLRSPVATEGANSAYQVGVGGGFLKYQVYMYTLAVAPAFCI